LFDYMFSADLFVEDMHRQVDALVERFGVHRPGPRSVVTDSSDAHTIICRLAPDLSLAPTRLEVIESTGSLEHWNGHNITQAWTDQLPQPTRFHNTVFIVPSLDEMAEELGSRGVPTMFDDTIEFDRLWVGLSPEQRTSYDPSYDAGMRIEVLPFDAFPIDREPPPRDLEALEPGALIRVVDRSFVVADLDAALSCLDTNLDWQPEEPVEEIAGAGYREAALACDIAMSAKLVLREPTDAASPTATFVGRWGEGPYALKISVNGLEARAEKLRERGVEFTEVGEQGDPRRHLRVGADVIGGSTFEFVENAD
jgi:hypothetical protein